MMFGIVIVISTYHHHRSIDLKSSVLDSFLLFNLMFPLVKNYVYITYVRCIDIIFTIKTRKVKELKMP
jgi:hypothetical protein